VKRVLAVAAIESRVDPNSEEFRANEAAMRALVDDLHAQIARVAAGGPPDAVA
jgi:3-methylcrotonyl-CoA carboxylase beta subunit